MYDLLLVRRRRRRRIAALVALFSSMGIASLVIISFLGRSVGTFTVSLKNSEVNLALVEAKDSNKYSTYLRINDSTPYIEHSFDFFRDELATLDNEETSYEKIGKNEYTYLDTNTNKIVKGTAIEFFKYTFYVKNVGAKTASYDMKITINDRTKADDESGRGLDDTLRVMVFENKPTSEEHSYRVFAKKAAENNYDINGNKTDRELIVSYDGNDHETEEYRLAENFKSGTTVAEYNHTNFIKNEMMRYTIVIWLEGGDPQSKPDEDYPEGATLKLGVDIAAHENA